MTQLSPARSAQEGLTLDESAPGHLTASDVSVSFWTFLSLVWFEERRSIGPGCRPAVRIRLKRRLGTIIPSSTQATFDWGLYEYEIIRLLGAVHQYLLRINDRHRRSIGKSDKSSTCIRVVFLMSVVLNPLRQCSVVFIRTQTSSTLVSADKGDMSKAVMADCWESTSCSVSSSR